MYSRLTAPEIHVCREKKSSEDQSIDCSAKPSQKWSQWKDGRQEAVLKEGKWVERRDATVHVCSDL